jgi:hypothetical protein
VGKRIALKDYIEIDHIDLSDFFSQIGFSSENEQVDVSGFNSTGVDEFLAGKNTASVSGTVFGAYGANETWAVLWPLHRDRTVFPIKWRVDSSAGVSATNPELRGNAQILSWSPGATRGSPDSFPVTFTPADSTGFYYSET